MIKKIIYKTVNIIYRVFNKIILVQGIKETFACYGKNVSLSYDIDVREMKIFIWVPMFK